MLTTCGTGQRTADQAVRWLRLFHTSKPQVRRTELHRSRPHLSITDDHVGVFLICLRRRPPVDHFGMRIPQRVLFVRGRFVGSLGICCIPYPAAVLSMASHRTRCFIHRRQSPDVLWRRGGVRPSSPRCWHTCCASCQSAPVRGHPGPPGAQMRSTPFPCTNRAWRSPSSMRWDTRRADSMPDTVCVRMGGPMAGETANFRGWG